MSKYGIGDFQQALRAYLQSGLDSGQVADAGNVPNTYLTAANKRWVIDQWVGCYVQITDGLAIGQFLQVASNTVDTMIFVEPWVPVIPDTTSIYKIMLPSPGMGVGIPVEVTNTSVAYGQTTEIDNSVADTLSVTLDTGQSGARNIVNLYLETNIDSLWALEVSTDNATWRLVDTINMLAGTSQHIPYSDNAYRYIRVSTAIVGNHTAEIVVSR